MFCDSNIAQLPPPPFQGILLAFQCFKRLFSYLCSVGDLNCLQIASMCTTMSFVAIHFLEVKKKKLVEFPIDTVLDN